MTRQKIIESEGEGASAASLGLLRIWVFGIWLVEVGFDPIERLARLPVTYFDPPSPLGLLPRGLLDPLLAGDVLLAFRLALAAGLGVVVLGAYRRTWVPGVVVAGLVVHQVLVRSFTTVSHNEVVLLYVAALLCFFPLTDALALRRLRPGRRSVERHPQAYAAPFLLAGLVLTLTYFATAAARLWKGLDLFTTSTLQDLVALHAADSPGIFGLGRGVPATLVRAVPAEVWKVAYLVATLLELAFPLAMVSRKARWILVPAMVAFHLAAWLLIGVRFVENVLLMVVLSTVTFHRVAAALDRRGSRPGERAAGSRRGDDLLPHVPI